MPIILITASNGHGKGQFAIKEILRLQDENDKREKEGKSRRQIYANIHGVNEPSQKPLKDVQKIPSDLIFFGKQDNPEEPPPEGYFVPPIGSIFFFDECQKLDWVKNKSGALSNDIRTRSLEEHRHAGLDIYFITQQPNYIHSHIQGLVSPHYYLERPLGMPISNVFMFNKFQKTPETAKAKADDHQTIKVGKHYGQYYKSSAEHNIKKTIPLKLKIAVGVLALVIAYTFYNYTHTKYYKQTQIQKTEQPDKSIKNSLNTSTTDLQSQTLKENQDKQDELYRQLLPPDYRIQRNNDDLRVSGVIGMSNRCYAYNAYGDLMTISQDDCYSYLTGVKQLLKKLPKNQSNSVTVEPIKPVVNEVRADAI